MDVGTVVEGLLSGSIPPQAGLSALLIKGRELPGEILKQLPYLTDRLVQDRDNDLVATNLEILANLLESQEASESVELLTQDSTLSRLLFHLNNPEFSLRYPLLRIFISIAKLKRNTLQRYNIYYNCS